MLPTSPCEVCVHFSGHGLEIDGENFLVPVDASSSASKEAIKQECISLQYLLDSFCKKLAEKVLLIFLLDCCRENPTKSIKFKKSSFAKLGQVDVDHDQEQIEKMEAVVFALQSRHKR